MNSPSLEVPLYTFPSRPLVGTVHVSNPAYSRLACSLAISSLPRTVLLLQDTMDLNVVVALNFILATTANIFQYNPCDQQKCRFSLTGFSQIPTWASLILNQPVRLGNGLFKGHNIPNTNGWDTMLVLMYTFCTSWLLFLNRTPLQILQGLGLRSVLIALPHHVSSTRRSMEITIKLSYVYCN